MRVPKKLAEAFGADFESAAAGFLNDQGLLPSTDSLQSRRFLARSIVPHAQKLSKLFNREEAPSQSGMRPQGLASYWKRSPNPANLRLSYFLGFMPSNAMRVASVWCELERLGYRWAHERRSLQAIEWGAGPASGACGVALGEAVSPVGLPKGVSWDLVEQDRVVGALGASWCGRYFTLQGHPDWSAQALHHKVDWSAPLASILRRKKFGLMVMSFFLNEQTGSAEELAVSLMDLWERALDDEGVVILVEPALRAESRRLLSIRAALIAEKTRRRLDWFKVGLPCLGEQPCGALLNMTTKDDWCHEQVLWWRPPYVQRLDKLTGLDHRNLPFTYLVIFRSGRTLREILPVLKSASSAHRLVSSVRHIGRDQEYFLCGQEGKFKARERSAYERERGDILVGAEIDARARPAAIKLRSVF